VSLRQSSLKIRTMIVGLLVLAWPAQASAEDKGTLSLIVENDLFGGTDQNYTNGLKASYVFPKSATPKPWRWVARNIMQAEEGDTIYAGVSLGHSIFTPRDITTEGPLPDQHPYAGWFYVGTSLLIDRGDVLDSLQIETGIVGPHAFGKPVQRGWHELINVREPRGWDNQLRDEPGLNVSVERKWRASTQRMMGLQADLTPNVGATVGNVLTQAKAGLTLRVGNNLDVDYGPPRIRPSIAGPGFFAPSDHLSWYLFAGFEGRAVARNIFLDGNSYRDSLSVDKKNFVGDAQFGAAIQIMDVQMTYTFVLRTEEFDTQIDPHRFGAISLSFKL